MAILYSATCLRSSGRRDARNRDQLHIIRYSQARFSDGTSIYCCSKISDRKQ